MIDQERSFVLVGEFICKMYRLLEFTSYEFREFLLLPFCKTCFGLYRWRHLPLVPKDPGRGPSIKTEEEKEEEEGDFNAAFFRKYSFELGNKTTEKCENKILEVFIIYFLAHHSIIGDRVFARQRRHFSLSGSGDSAN